MLPVISSAAKTTILGALALSIGLTAAAPAQALGKNERKFLEGVAAAMIVDRILDDARRRNQPRQQPVPQYYVPQQQYYVQPRPTHRKPAHTYRSSIYATPVAQAFNSYTSADRKRIQQRLAAQGYYRSGIDGSFGPGTYNAIVGYANDRGQSNGLRNTAGVYGIFDGLIY